MELTDLFKKFELNRLPKDVLNRVWLDSFSEVVDFPPEYNSFLEGINIDNLICCTIECVRNWLVSSVDKKTSSKENGEKSEEQFSWKNLAKNVDQKSLLCLLSAFIHKKKTDCITEKSRLQTIKSAHLYFLLLAIPGSKFFHIYNDNLYSHALEILQLCNLINTENPKPEAKGKGKKKQKRKSGSSIDKKALLNAMISLMDDLILVLKNFGFKNLKNGLETTVIALLEITKLEKENTSIVLKSPEQDSVSYLAHKAYFALTLLCSSEHGDVEDTVKLITSEMLKYLNASDEKDTKMTPGERAIIRSNSISFLHHLLTSVGEPSYDGIAFMVKWLCVRTPDKAEIRAKNVQTILDIIELMPVVLYAKLVFFIICLAHNGEIKNRVTALDILGRLVLWNERIKPNDENFVEEIFLNHKYLLSAIYGRCRDVSATVKTKAITVLGSCISSNKRSIKDIIEKIFVVRYRPSQNVSELTKSPFDMHNFINTKSYKMGDVNPLPGPKAVIDSLIDAISHEKVLIRKAAFQTLTNIFIVNKKWMTDEILKEMVHSCRDMSVLIRKTLIKCLTDLLMQYSSSEKIAVSWMHGVMPLIGDPESKSQEKTAEAAKTLILDNLVNNEETETPLHHLPWKLIKLIKDNMQKEFLIVCSKWIQYNLFDSALLDVIRSHIDTERNNYAWFLLCSLSGFTQIGNSPFILDYFYNNVHDEIKVDEDCCILVTEVLYYNWKTLTSKEQTDLKNRLLTSLSQFTVPLPLIARYVDMCNLITKGLQSPPKAARKSIRVWASKLIKTSEEKIVRRIGPGSPRVIDDEQLLCQLISTLGDATQICPDVMKDKTVVILKNILEVYQENIESGTRRWKGESGSAVEAVTLATVGKFCIQNKSIAETTVPLFAQVLNKTKYNAVKINAMIALADLFKRHTSLVENYVRDIYVCLKDNSIEIRLKALTLLIDLIQQDFLRLRCPMFFHLFTMIHDEAEVIRETVESFIFNIAIIKHKSIIAQHFIESVFHYNGYFDPAFTKTSMSRKEHQLFSISGKLRTAKRQGIYNFMLRKMLDEDRFRILYQLCYDILDKVVDGAISLNDSGKAVILDVFNIISSDSIQLKTLTFSPTDELEGKTDEELKPMDLQVYAQKNVLSQVVRQNMIENIMPVFISLKNKLISIRSPIIDDLRRCVLHIMKHYKDEVKVILKDDPQFAEEIAFDLERATKKDEENSEEILGRKITENFLNRRVAEAIVICGKFEGTEIEEIMATTLDRSLGEAEEDDPATADNDEVKERKKAAIADEALAAVYSPRTVQRTSKFTPIVCPAKTSCDILKSSFVPEAVTPLFQRYSPVPGTSKSKESYYYMTLSSKAGPSQSKESSSATAQPEAAAKAGLLEASGPGEAAVPAGLFEEAAVPAGLFEEAATAAGSEAAGPGEAAGEAASDDDQDENKPKGNKYKKKRTKRNKKPLNKKHKK